MTTAISLQERKLSTQSQLNGLRRSGAVPGVVYGKKVAGVAISVAEKQIQSILKTTPHAVLQVDVPGHGQTNLMIGEIQRDSMTRKLTHIDFHQIDMNVAVHTKVRIDLTGEAVGVKEGGMMQIQLYELDIKCLPHQIPESIAYDVSRMELGSTLLVEALDLPKDIEVLSRHDEVVASVLTPQKAEETDEAGTVDATEAAADTADVQA